MKKILPTILLAVAVVATAVYFLHREEQRLRALYRSLEERFRLNKNPMTVDF